MLARVDVRSRPEAQFDEKTEGPKGEVAFEYWGRCGMEPARNRDKSAALLAVLWSGMSPRLGEGDLKGLGEGLGRDVLATRDGSPPKPLVVTPPGENRDGTVPARARLVWTCGRLSGVGRCVKSGKPSVGDSGIFSRRGVELPLVGGPQTLTGTPSWACISRALLFKVLILKQERCV